MPARQRSTTAGRSSPRAQGLQNLEAVPYQARLAFLLGAISNVTLAAGSRTFRRAFRLGVGEVRLMYVLHYEGPLTAQQASAIIGVDKGAMSRTVAALIRRRIVHAVTDSRDARQRLINFTPAGKKLVAQVMSLALQREKQLYAVFTDDEFRMLSTLLQPRRRRLPPIHMDAPERRRRGSAERGDADVSRLGLGRSRQPAGAHAHARRGALAQHGEVRP